MAMKEVCSASRPHNQQQEFDMGNPMFQNFRNPFHMQEFEKRLEPQPSIGDYYFLAEFLVYLLRLDIWYQGLTSYTRMPSNIPIFM